MASDRHGQWIFRRTAAAKISLFEAIETQHVDIFCRKVTIPSPGSLAGSSSGWLPMNVAACSANVMSWSMASRKVFAPKVFSDNHSLSAHRPRCGRLHREIDFGTERPPFAASPLRERCACVQFVPHRLELPNRNF
ncbi:hypothetical protein ABZ942_42040 [Nocardia sp. NPDC046473]|uniref:hypothetical protein n=1 Tax=Nocardia sp. NPDC046473 TaxID=3155733 RepID=UPI003409A287